MSEPVNYSYTDPGTIDSYYIGWSPNLMLMSWIEGDYSDYYDSYIGKCGTKVIAKYQKDDISGVFVTILNLTDMSTKDVKVDSDSIKANTDRYFYPLSDGLFAIELSSLQGGGFKFFNERGKEVIDGTNYKLENNYQKLIFENGQCSFNIVNNAGTKYEITINKKGKVIDSVEID